MKKCSKVFEDCSKYRPYQISYTFFVLFFIKIFTAIIEENSRFLFFLIFIFLFFLKKIFFFKKNKIYFLKKRKNVREFPNFKIFINNVT
jgi:hypothetical protein